MDNRSVQFNSSNCSSGRDAESSNGEHPTFKVIKLLLYSIIFLISVVGNSLVCMVIARRRRMRTVTNYFILNLAIADLTVTCICIPFDIPVQENSYKWPYGAFMCKILYPLQTMSMFASIFTLTAVSLNRFWAIIYPLKRQMTKSHAVVAIISLWVISGLLTIPYTMVLHLDENSGQCDEVWPEPAARKAYTASLFVFQYMFPLTVITIAYVKIGQELRRCTGEEKTNAALRGTYQKESSKVVRMLIVVTLLFAVCVLPNNIMWMWLDFGRGNDYPHFWNVVAVTNIVLFANNAANPVAYTICHENFREEFKLFITCDPKFLHSRNRSFTRTLQSFSSTARIRSRFSSKNLGNRSYRSSRRSNGHISVRILNSKETVL